MKYYAIRTIDSKSVNKILTNWDECKKIVQGHNSQYKSFKTEEEAQKYINNYKQEEKEEYVLNSDSYIYYVDGSYMNDKIGWGFILTKNNKEITRMCGSIKENEDTSRNITGELNASLMAVRHAISNGYKTITIVNDYQGVSSFVTEAWKPKTKEAKKYTSIMNLLKNNNEIEVKFIKVKGHTGNKWNEKVDEVAKLGTTLY